MLEPFDFHPGLENRALLMQIRGGSCWNVMPRTEATRALCLLVGTVARDLRQSVLHSGRVGEGTHLAPGAHEVQVQRAGM